MIIKKIKASAVPGNTMRKASGEMVQIEEAFNKLKPGEALVIPFKTTEYSKKKGAKVNGFRQNVYGRLRKSKGKALYKVTEKALYITREK